MVERSIPLVDQVKKHLLGLIADDGFVLTGGQLPSEYQLSSQLKVSRSTVREALTELARQGAVIRRHGVGTFVNRNVQHLKSSITEVVEFKDLIASQGYKAEVKVIWVRVEHAGSHASVLGLDPHEEVVVVDKIFLADAKPVIFCRNTIPWRLIPERHRENTAEDAYWREPVYRVLIERCHEDVIYHVGRMKATAADQQLARTLECALGHPLLCIDEIGYNLSQEPVLHCLEHYRDDLIHFDVVRSLVRPFSWEPQGHQRGS